MFGQNVVTAPYPEEDGSLKVFSLWYTIQGEGPDAGRPAIFLRLSHCNLRCFFCDTAFDDGEVRLATELGFDIIQLSNTYNCKFVVITGGEPFLQNVIPLINLLNIAGIAVSIETAGTTFLPGIASVFAKGSTNKIICSPKTPRLSANLIPYIHSLKYIIRAGEIDERDGLPCMSTQIPGKVTQIYRPCQNLPDDTLIYVQPMDESDPEQAQKNIRAAVESSLAKGYRLSIQVHKIAGVD